jgi:hypothetical protein
MTEAFELAVEELDQVTGGSDVVTAFLVGFAKGLSEPLPKPTPTPTPPPSTTGGARCGGCTLIL